jgi:hypothetical protein
MLDVETWRIIQNNRPSKCKLLRFSKVTDHAGEIPEEPPKRKPDDVEEGKDRPGRGMSDNVVDDQTKDVSDDPAKPDK